MLLELKTGFFFTHLMELHLRHLIGKGELRAITGGGRYDNVLETFGGEPIPAAGVGLNLEML